MARLSDEFPAVNVQDVYTPTMMQFDGSTGYYSNTSVTTTGNKCTVVLRFSLEQTANADFEWLFSMQGPTNHPRCYVAYRGTTAASSDDQDRLFITMDNSVGTIIGRIYAEQSQFVDGEVHSMMVEIDGDNGTIEWTVDGQVIDDTTNPNRIAPTTGTLDTGAGSDVGVGSTDTGNTLLSCTIGFLGYADVGGLSYSDFFDSNNNPIKQDENNWSISAWGSQPLVWNEHGDVMDNKGSSSAFTHNGTITTSDEPVIATGFNPNYAVPSTPEVIDVYEDQNSTASSTQVLNVPTHQEGDFLLTCLMKRTGGGVVTPPAGWDYDGEYTNVGGYQRAQIYTRVATASEPASYTWTAANSDRIAGQMIAISNVTGIAGVTEDAGTGTTNVISMPVGSYGDVKWIFHHWIVASSGDAFTMTGEGTVQVDSGVNTQRRIGGGHTLYESDVTCVQSSSSNSATVCIHLTSA